MWRQTQCRQQLWSLAAPLPWSPQCSPDASKVPRALAEAVLVSGWECTVQAGTWKPQALLEFPHCSAAPHLHSSAAPDALGTERWGHTTGVPCPYWLPGAVDVTSISSSLRGQKHKKQPAEPRNQELGFLYLFMISSWLGLTRWTSMIQITHQWNANNCSSWECNEIPLTLFYCFAILTLRHLFLCRCFPGGYCLNEMEERFVLFNIHCHTIWKSQPGFTNWLFFLFTQEEHPEYQIIREVCLSTVLLEQDCCIICELSHGETKRRSCNKSPGKSCYSGDQSETSFIQRQLIYS